MRDLILAGDYQPGDQLPANRRLASEYGTTLSTLRSALQVLSEQGWVSIVHGVGTFVADIGAESDMLSSLSEGPLGSAGELVTRLVGVGHERGNGEVLRLLGLRSGTYIVQVDRVRLIGGQSAVFQRSYLPGRYWNTVRAYQGAPSLYRFLRVELGVLPVHARERLTAVELPQEPADHLGCQPGGPVLQSRRVSSTHDGTPVIVDYAYIASDLLAMVVDRHGRTTHAVLQTDEPLDGGRA